MKFNVRLRLMKDKKDTKNTYPVIVSAFSSKRKNTIYRYLGIRCAKSYWDRSKQRVKNNHPNFNFLNKLIDDKIGQLQDAYLQLKDSDPDLEDLFNYLEQDKNAERKQQETISPKRKGKLVLNVIEEFREFYKGEKAKEYLRTFNQLKYNLNLFNPNLMTLQLDKEFWMDYKRHLIAGNLQNSTINLHLKMLRAIVTYCEDKGMAVDKTLKTIKGSEPEPDTFALNMDELQALIEVELDKPYLVLTRAMFLCFCLTGFRLNEMRSLKKTQLINNEHIDYKRQSKNKKKRMVYLPDLAQSIMKHFSETTDGEYVFPKLSEVKFRHYLKDVAKIAKLTRKVIKTKQIGSRIEEEEYEIHQLISPHWGRHFYTTWINKQTKDIVLTKEILGHGSINTTSRYAHNNEDIGQVVKDTFGFAVKEESLKALLVNPYSYK